MTRDDIITIMKILKASYPAFYKDMTKADANDIIDLWAMMFVDDEARIVVEAVKAMITTLKFPPTIADVKEKIRLIIQPAQMTELEAWNLVRRAISYYDAPHCFDKLPPILQKLVGSPGQLREWSQMPIDQITVVSSNFQRSYKARIQHETQMQALPESTKAMIEGLSDKFLIEY